MLKPQKHKGEKTMENNKIKELVGILIEKGELTKDEIISVDFAKYSENVIEIKTVDYVYEYLVVDDNERDTEFYNYQESLFDDMGIDGFTPSFQETILNECLNTDRLQFDFEMDCDERAYGELIDDIREWSGIDSETSEDDAREQYKEMLIEMYNDPVEYFKELGCDNDFFKDYIDFDKVVELVKEYDGYGCLASYDGVEIETDNYYVYLLN